MAVSSIPAYLGTVYMYLEYSLGSAQRVDERSGVYGWAVTTTILLRDKENLVSR
jgi:hypothetical protein